MTRVKSRRYIPFKRLLRWVYYRFKNWRFQQFIHSLSEHMYHGPNYHLMPFPNKSIVTIHDLSVFRHPECHRKEHVEYWQHEIHNVTKQAAHIITVSEFQRQEILDLLDVEPDKVSVVYLGVESKFRLIPRMRVGGLLKNIPYDISSFA